MTRVALYARVSTSNGSQNCENQLLELRRYCEARGWEIHEEYTLYSRERTRESGSGGGGFRGLGIGDASGRMSERADRLRRLTGASSS